MSCGPNGHELILLSVLLVQASPHARQLVFLERGIDSLNAASPPILWFFVSPCSRAKSTWTLIWHGFPIFLSFYKLLEDLVGKVKRHISKQEHFCLFSLRSTSDNSFFPVTTTASKITSFRFEFSDQLFVMNMKQFRALSLVSCYNPAHRYRFGPKILWTPTPFQLGLTKMEQ